MLLSSVRQSTHAVRAQLALTIALTLTALALFAGPARAADPTFAGCMANATIETISGTFSQQVKYASPAAGTTFDARNATFTAYPTATLYPFTVGRDSAPPNLCVVGGKVVGQQSRSLTWDEMKTSYDGDGLRISGNNWYAVDGLRVDNVEDGVAPRGTENLYPKDGDGFTMRNLYMTFVRDDCVENDDIAAGVVSDSLFDGCYTGISERPSSTSPQNNHPAPAGETITLDHVLLRLQAMPGPRGTNNAATLGHGQLFKWSPVSNGLVVRDSIFLVEKQPNGGAADFPASTVASNVTIVWLGGGAFPGKLPASGVTVTTDRTVWDTARAEWLRRHGCTSFDVCTKLHTPDPIGAPAPTPTSTATPGPTPAPTPTSTPTPGPTPTSSPSPATLTFGSSADATIAKSAPSKNFGSSRQLYVDGTPDLDSLLKFKVSGIGSRKIVRARLVLTCLTSSASGGSFWRSGSSWSEGSVTWSNAPAASGSPLATVGAVQAGKAYTIDITSLITGDGTFSLRLSSGSSAGTSYGSREVKNGKEGGSSKQRPRLLIDVA